MYDPVIAQTMGFRGRCCDMVRISETGYVLKVGSAQQNLLRDGMWGVDFLFFRRGRSLGRAGLRGMGN